MEREYLIKATSWPAPFVCDDSHDFIEGISPKDALERFAAKYSHPCSLYKAECFDSADAMYKGEKHLALWLCNHEQARLAAIAARDRYAYIRRSPEDFDINGIRHSVSHPKKGSVV